jgi:hypothetical protein
MSLIQGKTQSSHNTFDKGREGFQRKTARIFPGIIVMTTSTELAAQTIIQGSFVTEDNKSEIRTSIALILKRSA